MKRSRLFTLLIGMILASSGAFAVGNGISNKKAKAVEATSISNYSNVYRFSVPNDFGSDVGNHIYLHAWGSNGGDTTWGNFITLSDYSYNENSERMYTLSTDYSYTGFIIIRYSDNPNYCKTADITVGSNKAWYWNGSNGGNASAWTPSNQIYYFYDYRNQFSGNPSVKGKQSNGSLDSGNYAAMTKVANTSYVYSVSLDPAFDQFEIKNGSISSDYIWINQNRGHAYCNWDPTPGWADNFDYVKAHDWALQTMHLRDLSTANNSDTNACRGDSGYYKKAKTDYNSFSSGIKAEISKLSEFNDAKARMSAWAVANGETASWSGTTLTISSARTSILPNANFENTNTIAIIVIVSLVSITAIGGFFFIRKRKSI